MPTYSVDPNIRKKYTINVENVSRQYTEPISAIPTLTNSSTKEIAGKISAKPMLIMRDDISKLGGDINLVGFDPLVGLIANSNKTFSCKLLNWVEPYTIAGIVKTLFYTSVNTELKAGDRVFIINGSYDSDLLIQNNKYKQGRDGYKILYVDKCKVVLDIDYTGVLPCTGATDDDFIKIYHIRDKFEFLYANRAITTRDGQFKYRFSYYQNNIAFIDQDYAASPDWGLNNGITSTPGFFVRDDSGNWTNITTQIMSGSYSYALSPTYINVDRIKVMNSDFTYSGTEFRKDFIYKYTVGSTQSSWITDVVYFEPYLTKNNFRDGVFKGVWNSGLYGQYSSKIKWHGVGSTWNVGALINTEWQAGTIDSVYTASQSYFSNIDDNGLTYQKANSPNNAGRGYNFISNCSILQSEVVNGTFKTTIFGSQSATFSVVEDQILKIESPVVNKITNSFFDKCQFNNSHLTGSELKNTVTNNSKLEKTKVINSYLNNSVLSNSIYNSDNIIKIQAYDEFSASETTESGTTYSRIPGVNQKVYKFYIDEDGYNRLTLGDTFYITGLKINNNSKEVINFFDKKFKIGTWTEYTEESFTQSKYGYEYGAFLSTPGDNSYEFYSQDSGYWHTSTTTQSSHKSLYSIDIWASRYTINDVLTSEIIDYDHDSATNLPLNKVIDITSAYIVDSDFNSGLIEESDWNSGSHIEPSNDTNIAVQTADGGTYSLSIDSNCYLIATTSYSLNNPECCLLATGSVVFLNSVDFYDGVTNSRIGDAYKIVSNTSGVYQLSEIGTQSLIGLSASVGEFYTHGAQNRYGYLRKLKFHKVNVKSGFLRRSYLSGSLIQNIDYNYLDKDYNDLSKVRNLVVSDSIFSDCVNILSNATYLNTSFVGGLDTWNSGIVQNSIWNGMTFSNGVIRDTRWVNGTFLNGIFYNSKTFNGASSVTNPYYYSENINSYYKNGGVLPNNRNSWQDGIFENGDFYKSDWEFGTFSNGKFYQSKWYDGVFVNGVLGSNAIPSSDTVFYNGTFSNGIVENATLYASDTSYTVDVDQNINWVNGTFENGIFGSNIDQINATHSAIWYNGIFNGGQFISNAKWKNGTFNGGKFISGYGWSLNTNVVENCTWEGGTFNGGEFGNANGQTNSTWYTGDFNDGVFKGREWNNGVFVGGEFQGSGLTATGGLTCSNASDFVNSYTYSYWGKWKNGIFTNTKDKFIKDQKFFTTLVKAEKVEKNLIKPKSAKFKNALWIAGTFSHQSGEMINSVWLDGAFESGKFNYSSFNPYVIRDQATVSSFNLNDDTCYWENGDLQQSEFYISHWKNGNFTVGTAVGMIWENGINNYMNAFNVFWEDGIWRNGNWYGSSFDYNGNITDDYTLSIIRRGMSWSNDTLCHIWNIFEDKTGIEVEIASGVASDSGWSDGTNISAGIGGGSIGEIEDLFNEQR